MKKINFVLIQFLAVMMLAGCFAAKTTPQSVHYAVGDSVPYRIAILPAQYITHAENSTVHKSILVDDDDKAFVADIARSAIYNQLAGKGYLPLQKSVVDDGLAGIGNDQDWKSMSSQDLCKLLKADGIVRINISSADMITAVAFDLFQLDAGVELENSAGELVGKWSESASKRKVAVPTGIFSLAGTIAEEIFADPTRRQMRMVIYDWAWNLAQMLPDCPKGPKLPEIISVDTNVDNKIFGVGKRIVVRVDAEPDLTCSFDLGDFKKNIQLSQTSEGVYEGFYVVHEGDKGVDEKLLIRMRKSNGIERLWVESGSLATIDGILPPSPKSVIGIAGKEGTEISWKVPKAEDLDNFVIEKGTDPVGEFEVIGKTHGLSFVDNSVSQGATVYYKVRTMDRAGNLSSTDEILKVVVPQFDERELLGELTGTLVKGNYLIKSLVTVPQGATLTILPGTRVRFNAGARMNVSGELKSLGEIRSPIKFESSGTEGFNILSGGSAIFSICDFSGFSKAVISSSGYSEIRSSSFDGGGEGNLFAVTVLNSSRYYLKGLRISGLKTGVILSSGNGSMVRSSISNCTTGLEFNGGNGIIKENNIFDNEINIFSGSKLVVEENYFGTAAVDKIKVKGDVLVKSLLDSPYPHGRKIVLVDDRTITPKLLDEKFNKLKEEGENFFHKQQYGDAYQKFEQALKIKSDRDIYLYFSYTLLALQNDAKLKETLSEGISKFPYDVRLHQLYVRSLLSKGEVGQARLVLEKALTLSPADSSLLYLKDYMDHLVSNDGAETNVKNDDHKNLKNEETSPVYNGDKTDKK
ncbi:right-handed parallel beta-helix repeat-containing protein [Desulfovibrio sp. UCD-KL4C]|uniref:right-handed parallel beta-helix repeat-containing protein n=1 Tax=Desulfovibrio sp. UCD-KL4C TaxID=2578120 RepID=UPI0025BB0A61|nr:right-handed parallel beta-helix repeat-containing protein [Desulfovibrio sp. UCD-KL4C]